MNRSVLRIILYIAFLFVAIFGIFNALINCAHGDTIKASITSAPYILVDDLPRKLGGDLPSDIPAQKFPFTVFYRNRGVNVLTIGSMDGVGTSESPSTPAVVKINGVKVTYVLPDMKTVRVDIPVGLLKVGQNILEIQSGYYIKPSGYMAYDVITFRDITMEVGE